MLCPYGSPAPALHVTKAHYGNCSDADFVTTLKPRDTLRSWQAERAGLMKAVVLGGAGVIMSHHAGQSAFQFQTGGRVMPGPRPAVLTWLTHRAEFAVSCD